MARQYNFIYSSLVHDEDDFVGHIAYALYKTEKVAYIEKFKSEHEGKEPTEEDLKPFNDMTSAEVRLQYYLQHAERKFSDWMKDVLDEHGNVIEQDCNANHLSLISEAIKPLKAPSLKWQYFHGAMQGVLGAFIFMLLMCFLLFLLTFSSQQYTITLGGNGTANIQTGQVTVVETDTLSIEK